MFLMNYSDLCVCICVKPDYDYNNPFYVLSIDEFYRNNIIFLAYTFRYIIHYVINVDVIKEIFQRMR